MSSNASSFITQETAPAAKTSRSSAPETDAVRQTTRDSGEALSTAEVACAPFIEKAMDLCNEKGASIVVRVIPDPHRDIGLQIMSYFHYSGDVQIITCETLDQAKDILRAET